MRSARVAFAVASLWSAGRVFAGCGNGDDNGAAVPAADAGSDATVDAGTAPQCIAPTDAASRDGAAQAVSDGALPDPLNACPPSYVTTMCIPFDAARVPAHPKL